MYFNDAHAGVKNLGVKVGYDLSKVGVNGATVALGYNKFSGATDVTRADYTVIGGKVGYKFAGSLKGLSALAKYESKKPSGASSQSQFRFYATYSF